MKYVILKTESQKDGIHYQVMEESEAVKMIEQNAKWRHQFEIVADVTDSVKCVLSNVSRSFRVVREVFFGVKPTIIKDGLTKDEAETLKKECQKNCDDYEEFYVENYG